MIIVGAGPAGSFAAERLARAGVRVALFDGRPEGEPKACGGGVTSKALKAWPHLLEAVGRTIDELDMYSPSGKHLHLKLEEPFAVYSRIAFDTFLRERARKAGAQVSSQKNLRRRDSNERMMRGRSKRKAAQSFRASTWSAQMARTARLRRSSPALCRRRRWKSHSAIARRCLSHATPRRWLLFCQSGLATPGRFRGSIM